MRLTLYPKRFTLNSIRYTQYAIRHTKMTKKHFSIATLSLMLIVIGLLMGAKSNPTPKIKPYTWTGTWHFTRTSAADGITALDIKIGKNVLLPNNDAYLQTIYNVNNKFPGSQAWTTLAVGELTKLTPTAKSLPEKEQEAYLSTMDKMGVKVFIELFPFKKDDVGKAIDLWLSKYKHHKSVIGVGIELEYFHKATDSMAKAWDEKIKSHKASYRLFLRHYDPTYMPPSYRGKGDLLFIDDASEGTRADLNKGFAAWAKRFAPTACAFQIGYPADEDGMNGNNATGWWKLKDPIKQWGDEILALASNPNQQLGLIWVTVKSGKSYHQSWDLTKGAKLPKPKN